MKLDQECKGCLFASQLKKVEKDHPSPQKLDEFKAEVKKLCQNAPQNYCAPLLMRDIDGVHRKIFGKSIDYSTEKRAFNDCLLVLEDEIYARITAQDQPIKWAIKYAMASNYIDFARLSNLDEGSVAVVIDSAQKSVVDEQTYDLFLNKLKCAKSLLYLHDNCGEIVLDKILIRIIKNAFPQLEITSVVRGGEIINDATEVDARQIDLYAHSTVVQNGANVPGTYLKEINQTTKNLLKSADVIISKGLGNLETLFGAGYSIFYLFMCKCNHVATAFCLPLWSTAFVYQGK